MEDTNEYKIVDYDQTYSDFTQYSTSPFSYKVLLPIIQGYGNFNMIGNGVIVRSLLFNAEMTSTSTTSVIPSMFSLIYRTTTVSPVDSFPLTVQRRDGGHPYNKINSFVDPRLTDTDIQLYHKLFYLGPDKRGETITFHIDNIELPWIFQGGPSQTTGQFILIVPYSTELAFDCVLRIHFEDK